MKINQSSPTKRSRRTRRQVDELKGLLYRVVKAYRPVTVRQAYYRMVAIGAIDKTEAEYQNTVVRLLGLMRRSGELPFSWIADHTRWMRKPESFDSMEDALQMTASVYRRELWTSQPSYVEVWLEKDALAGVIFTVTSQWDVPLMVTRGYPSLTFLHSAADELRMLRRPAYLYYLGDHDPSGVDIPRKVEEGLREFAPNAEIYFKRLAVTEAQIDVWNLPTRPTKRSDSRAKNFKGGSVEVDAIEPAVLRQIVGDAIESHVDRNELNVLKVAEESERSILHNLARGYR